MLGKLLLIFFAVPAPADPGSVEARSEAILGSPEGRNDLKSHSDDHGYLPGRRSFYGYPRHRHIDDGRKDDGSFARSLYASHEDRSNYDRHYGSPYYGTNYGAPYHGGSYYDGGVYYRERRD